MMHNNLFLHRLIIHTNENKIAYDETFHKGINIINGDNSSGKSTISHFIFYVLGGYFNDWVKEAKKCTRVIAEVEMNGAVFTIGRAIQINTESKKGNSSEPIFIYWGIVEDSLKASANEWFKYNYNTTSEKKSFSNIFFDNLDLPVVKEESNITFHQILRLLYVDQESPTSSLFYYEQFDTTLIRETVSDLLLGVYNQNLYDAKTRKVEAEKEFDDVKKEIKVIKQFTNNDLHLFPEHIYQLIAGKEAEIHNLEEQLIQLKEKNKIVQYTKNTKLNFQQLNDEAIIQRQKVNELDTEIKTLKYEIEDSHYFIETLESKQRAIKNSVLTREFLGDFPLDYCPECLSDLKKNDDITACKLCKEPVDQSFGVTQARKIEQDLNFQIKESKSLQIKNQRRFLELTTKIDSEKIKLSQIQIQVNSALKDVKSVRDEKIDALYGDKGFLEGEIIQFGTLLENAEMYQKLVESKDKLDKEIDFLNTSIKSMQGNQEQLKKVINAEIEKKGLYLLNNDLKRQDDFIAAKEFNIDYRNNIAFIADKDAKYSASSNFYLKTAARFAIFLASLEIEKMRYPRFILCDNMEDKGIEQARAYNFQKIIIEEANKYDSNNFQMIYTTSYLPPELKNSSYIVGEYYTKINPSLKNID
ncbi:hypothetical protein Q765_19910 [Flavobacterium rivuli WB 3.3-2 = DSM 21788]|uniref:Rad50/SbcC-type AAA domain-containing protein n=1 Tax=Flavobacterium rivuli WB 3.3-2 = DSM 21788 TaxID=1121895 RepID=A0A0A2LZL8_9FLAO|nr:hypothetical protein [Flavobacterium rivuli]KGO84776.1 hypothetical protein Q765_19910 [Flavobacterium rivuli WB 3.3-2 = DSM 21788]